MSRIRYAVAAAALVATLWAQNAAPPAGAAEQPVSQSQQPDASAPPAAAVPPGQPNAGSDQPAAHPAPPPPSAPDSRGLVAIKSVRATYPIEAQREKLQGEVVVKIVVSETGDVESAEVLSGHPVLAKAAISAVKKWKFQPFIKNGKPVKASVKLPFDFAFSDKVIVDETSKATSGPPEAKNTPNTGPPEPESTPNSRPDAPERIEVHRIRVSSAVTQGLLLRKVAPVYPDDARTARIQGTVVLQAVISKDGTIKTLHVVSGHPMLTQAALDAVQQWRYRPYILNNEPVEVDTTIEVRFTLR